MPATSVAAAAELQLPLPEPWDLGQPEQFRAVLQLLHLALCLACGRLAGPRVWPVQWLLRLLLLPLLCVGSPCLLCVLLTRRWSFCCHGCCCSSSVSLCWSPLLVLALSPGCCVPRAARVCLPMTCLSCTLLMLIWMPASQHLMLRWCVWLVRRLTLS